MCLGFTGSHVAWADDAQSGPPRPDLYVEDPYAPHHTNGSEARIGTIVGFVYGQPENVLALGVAVAGGYRFGRLTIESELQAFTLRSHGEINTPLGPGEGDFGVGHGERLARARAARRDPARPARRRPELAALDLRRGRRRASPGPNGASPITTSRRAIVPDDTKRPEGQVGFGISLDHRLQEPIGFPHRIAWFLGWRLALAPHEPMTATVCRGISCRPYQMEDDTSAIVDRSMLFQSSLAFTF